MYFRLDKNFREALSMTYCFIYQILLIWHASDWIILTQSTLPEWSPLLRWKIRRSSRSCSSQQHRPLLEFTLSSSESHFSPYCTIDFKPRRQYKIPVCCSLDNSACLTSPPSHSLRLRLCLRAVSGPSGWQKTFVLYEDKELWPN